MDINKILDYQKKDFEIIKLEFSLNESPNKKAINQILSVVKETQDSSAELEKNAEEILAQFNNLKKTYADNIRTFLTLSKKNSEKLNEMEVDGMSNLMHTMASNLSILEKKLLSLAEKVSGVLSGYETAKKKYQKAREKHKEFKDKFDKEQSVFKPQVDKLLAELKSMEKGIEAKYLAKYKEKRQDNIFPVFVKFTSNACGGCMMELPSAQIEKLKKESILECENCHRLMFLE